MHALKALAVAATLLAGAAGAQATLINRGGGLIYDSTLNITWMSDMNYAKTSGVDADGRMNWVGATAWAANLVYGGFDDWRLPTLNALDTSCSDHFDPGPGFPIQYNGFNCTGGELSHLFVADLGNRAHESILDQTDDTAEQVANLALFSNLQVYGYWSGTTFAPSPIGALTFMTGSGSQSHWDKNADFFYAVAVRDGDVAGDVAGAVPEPRTLALVLAAMGAAAVLRRTRPS